MCKILIIVLIYSRQKLLKTINLKWFKRMFVGKYLGYPNLPLGKYSSGAHVT
jgi:hypothetical protein